MSEREQAQVPEGSVVITPQQSFDMMLAIRDEVKHLSSVVDPALAQIRGDVAENAGRIDVEAEQRKAAVDKEAEQRKASDDKLETRIRSQETAGYVTGGRMWTGVGVLAAVVAALATVLVLILR